MKVFNKVAWVLGLFFFLSTANLAHADIETTKIRQADQPASLVFEFTAPSFDLQQESGDYKSVRVTGLYPMSEYGKPALFTTGKIIVVPQGYKPQLTVVEVISDTINNTLVAPAQRRFRCGGNASTFELNTALYKSAGVFPKSAATLSRLGSMQGIQVARIGFNPFRQDFASKSLIAASSIKVRVDFVADTVAANGNSKTSETFRRLLSQSTVNGDVIDAGTDAPESMLVVTADRLANEIQPLVNWKVAQGLKVDVVSFSQAGGSKEGVRQYIQNQYDADSANALTYVLLVGNADSMPTFFRSTGSGSAASDYVFSLVDGDDDLPDLLVGRILADNTTNAKIIVSRILDYEKSVQADKSWYPKGSTIASREGSNPSDQEYAEQIQKALKDYTYNEVDQFYQGSSTATPSGITDALNSGRSWLTYIGHGSGTSWGSTNGSFSNSTIDRLHNPNRLPVIVDVACQNGSFAKIDRCFGEAWVTHTVEGQNAGAVGYYGGSVNISWHPPAIMSVGSAKYHFERESYRLGATTLAGQLYLIEKSGLTSGTIDNMEWYNLFGDPSMTMRTATPKAYNLAYTTALNADQRAAVQVKATDAQSGEPVAGLQVSLSRLGEGLPMAVGSTNAQGYVQLNLESGQTTAGAMLTTTGYNAESKSVKL